LNNTAAPQAKSGYAETMRVADTRGTLIAAEGMAIRVDEPMFSVLPHPPRLGVTAD